MSKACLFEDPETGTHRPRNYVATLESGIAFLENKNTSNISGDEVSSASSNAGHQTCNQPSTYIYHEVRSSSMLGLSMQAGLLDVRSSQAEPQYLGSSSTFAFSRIVNSAMSRHFSGEATSVENSHSGRVLLPRNFQADAGLTTTLSNAYFAHIQPQYPFLHEPTFRLWEKQLANQAPELTVTNLDSAAIFMVHMVGILYAV